MINEVLAESRGIDNTSRERIKVLQKNLDDILNNHEKWLAPNEVAEIVETYEYALQRLWGFPTDRRYHRYSHFIKGCTCPKEDNDELVGRIEERWIDRLCPFHN